MLTWPQQCLQADAIIFIVFTILAYHLSMLTFYQPNN